MLILLKKINESEFFEGINSYRPEILSRSILNTQYILLLPERIENMEILDFHE